MSRQGGRIGRLRGKRKLGNLRGIDDDESNLDVSDMLIRSAIIGGMSIPATYLIAGGISMNKVPTRLGNLPQALVIGSGAAVGSLVGDLSSTYLIPYLPSHVLDNDLMKTAVFASLAGVGTIISFWLINGYTPNYGRAFLVGALSAIAGDYVYDNFIDTET